MEMKLQKKDVWKFTKKERERLKGVYIRAILREVNEQFGKKVNQDLNGNRKSFWKELRQIEER